MKTVSAYCLDWHINISSAFTQILVNPLRDFVDLKLQAWNSKKVDWPNDDSDSDIAFFCMLPPPPHILEKKDIRIIWVPMWDQACLYAQEWWNALPKNVHIIAFCNAVAVSPNVALATCKLSTLVVEVITKGAVPIAKVLVN